MPELQVIARHRITAGHEREVLAVLPDLVRAARAEPGTVSFDAYRSMDDDRAYVLLERYTSREAFAAHRETEHFQQLLLAAIVPRLESRTTEEYDVVAR